MLYRRRVHERRALQSQGRYALDFDRILNLEDKTFLAQTAALFLFMVCQQILGKTRFGSWLGLAKAVVWFIVRTVFGRFFAIFKKGDAQKEENSNGTADREEG